MRWPVNMKGADQRSHAIWIIDYFDDFRGPNEWAFLSNFYAAPIAMEAGICYPTTEHYFQSWKPIDQDERVNILRAPGPVAAKALGNSCQLRPDWDRVKVDVMLMAVRAKFTQHPVLGSKLIKTGDALLVEGNTWGDRIWGAVDGDGENLLGLILMLVRAELRLRR